MDRYISRAHSIVSRLFQNYIKTYHDSAVFVSGGIDSSLIASYVGEYFSDAQLISLRTDYSKDEVYVSLLSDHLQKKIIWVDVDKPKMQPVLSHIKQILKEKRIQPTLMQLSLATGFYFLFQKAREMNIRTVFTGQGPDILFAGYHKYKSVPQEQINAEIQKDLPLLVIDSIRDSAMAQQWGIQLLNPYLEKEFVEFSLSIDPSFKIQNGIEKFFMREWGRMRKLPIEIINRPKKAFQYSTGIQTKLQKMI